MLVLFLWRITPNTFDLRSITRASLREVWSFGSKVFAFTGFKHLLRTADSFLVGLLFGPEKLGLYNFSQRVTAAPTKAVQFGLGAYLFPKASANQDSAANLKQIFLSAYATLNYLVLTFSALLLTVGSELLILIFGPQWQAAIDLIQILVFVQFLAPVLVPVAELLKASNHPNWLLSWSILVAATAAAALCLGAAFSFKAAVGALTLAWWLTLPFTVVLLRKVVRIELSEFWRMVRYSYFFPMIAAVAMFLVAGRAGHSLAFRLIIISSIVLVQLAAMHRFDPHFRSFTKALIRRRPDFPQGINN